MQAVPIRWFPVLMACVLLTGCGQGEYDSRMSGAAGAIARRAAKGPQELAGAHSAVVNAAKQSQGLKVRFPTFFTAQVTALDASQPTAKMMQADLPGFCYTMERPLADDAGKNIPAYCYLYSVPKADTDNLHNLIQQAAAVVGGGGWVDDAPVKAPTGDIAVKSLRAAGEMEFMVNGVPERLPAQVEVYSFDAGANRVVIGFRAADSAAKKHNFFTAVEASMASAQLDGPAAAVPPPAAPAPAAGS